MDKDTIEIHSYLIRDSALYSLVIIYFLFFLLFFLCIVNFQTIRRYFFGPTEKLHLLPLHSTNLNRPPTQRYYDKYKYTNLSIKRPSDYDSFSDVSDDRNSTFAAPQGLKDSTRPAIQSPDSPPTSQTFGQSFSDRKKDLITFPTLSPSTDPSEQAHDKQPKRKKYKCDFKLKNKRCFNKNCKRRNVLSKIFCKYYSRLRPSSVDQSDSVATDQSSTVYGFGQTPSKPPEDEQSPDKELDREKALKCYQDFLENRFCRPGGPPKSTLRANEPEEKTSKKEELKRITDEAASNAKILTPKQLRKYEPFKAEIANPVTRAKPVARDLGQESDNDDDAKDLEQCKYVELIAPDGKDLKKSKGSEGDFNFLRLADDLMKSKNKYQKAPRTDKDESPSFVKSKKFYLEPERRPAMKNKDPNDSQSDEDDSELNGFFDLENLSKNKRTIPDLNEMYRRRIGDPKDTKSSPFERSSKEFRPFDGRTNGKPPFSGDRSDKRPSKLPDKTSLDEDITSKLRKELEKAKQEKAKLLKKQDKPTDKLSDELSSPVGKDARPTENASESHVSEDLSPKSRKARDEGSRKDDEASELAKGSDESISPLVDRMKSEMKHMKPIEFKPLQTVYLKEKARPSEEINELKISRVPKEDSRSPSLNSERLFSRNMDLNEENLIRDKPDDLMNLSKPPNQPKDRPSKDPESRVGKVNLNNILSLKDRQLEPSEKPFEKQPNRPLNVTSIDRQASNEPSSRPRFIDPDQFEQIGKIDSRPDKPNKLASMEKQGAQAATGKKSRIPLLNDKLKKSKSLTLYKKSLFGRNRSTKDERIDRDLERMFNLKFKR